MPPIDVTVPTPDGVAPASLHVPADGGPSPVVIMYPDAASLRPVFRDMGERLSALGYVVLVPDIYYRAGAYEPFSFATIFSDPAERRRLGHLVSALTPDAIRSDAVAFADFLAARPEVAGTRLGTTGYCLGGRLSLTAAALLGERVAAAASFHGGRLAVADDPASPHRFASEMRAEVYVAAAANDRTFDDDQAGLLDETYKAAGVDHAIDHYDAAHGFAVVDNPSFDEAAAERHWTALANLYGRALR